MSERDAYGTPEMDDIDAILAEFHREERSESASARPRTERQPVPRAASAPAPAAGAPMSRAQRREAEERRTLQTQLFETGETPAVKAPAVRRESGAEAELPRRAERPGSRPAGPAAPAPKSAAGREPSGKLPSLEPEEEIARETRRLTGGDRQGQQRKPRDREEQVRREARAAKRRRRGRISIACALLALMLALGGLLFWTIRDEQKNIPEEPVPLQLDLGEQLEDYLYDSSIKSHG